MATNKEMLLLFDTCRRVGVASESSSTCGRRRHVVCECR